MNLQHIYANPAARNDASITTAMLGHMNNRARRLLIGVSTPIVVTLVAAAIHSAALMIAILGCIMLFGVFTAIKGWWRRAYALTLISMVAGASGFETLGSIGSLIKVIAVTLLLSVTIYDSAGKTGVFATQSHKMMMSALWLLAGFAIVSLIWSNSRLETLTDGGTVTVLVYVLHRTSTVRWQDRNTMVGDIGLAYWTTTALLAIGAVLAFAGMEGTVGGNGRHQGLFSNPNLLGIIATVSLTIGLGLALEKRHPGSWASLLVPASCIVLSQSRTAIIAAGVGIIWGLLRGNLTRIIPIGLTITLVVLITQITGLLFFRDALSRFTANQGGDLLNTRADAWSEVLWNIQENPLGAGWAATRVTMEDLYLAGLTDSGMFTMHNSWFQILNELGWAGLLPMGLLIVATLRIAFTARPIGIGAGLVATTVAGSLTHLTESVMFGIGQPYPFIFWFAVFAAVVNSNASGESNEKDKIDQKSTDKYFLRQE